ncbi:uncharacterized protein LOC142327948 isoform X7 [Lycorma delicatula]|uniref:uncharacterized protein LOC142327948 isoform X7 n=1 Tax=Lycorma delicatula TaxID=130591 RepID=UPI003F5188A9
MFQGSGFGAASTRTPFGQTSTFGKPASLFTAPAFGSTSSSLFGQTTQPQTSSLFGNTAPAPAFGQPQTMQPSFGAFGSTAGGGTTVKFTPVIGTDTMVKNRVTQTGRTSS